MKNNIRIAGEWRPRAARLVQAGFYSLLLLAAWIVAAHAAPKAELWPKWQANDPASTQAVDHSAWDKFLKTYIPASSTDGINRLAYGKVTPADRQALNAYVERLAQTAVSRLNRAEQQAYWTNLYNALTVKVILDHYPVKSIRDIKISPGLFAAGPWGKKLIKVEGEEIALDDIEHRILRPIWRDPRVHYAVNCASIGCPNLARDAYTPANMNKLLDDGAKAYVNHPRGLRVDGNKVITSSIYDWFQEDFGGNAAGVFAHMKKYAGPELAQRLASATRIDSHDYDWGLNEAK